jgi:hypothetical protein
MCYSVKRIITDRVRVERSVLVVRSLPPHFGLSSPIRVKNYPLPHDG